MLFLQTPPQRIYARSPVPTERLTLLIIVFVLACGPAAGAATLPSISVSRPEPAALQAGWWRYFEVEGKELDQRIEETKQRLKSLLTELPKETAEAARPLIESIKTNLDALAKASTTQPRTALTGCLCEKLYDPGIDRRHRTAARQAGRPYDQATQTYDDAGFQFL